MLESIYGVKKGSHIPAATLHRYLTDYAKEFGIFERTHFNTRVKTIEAVENDEWVLHITLGTGDSSIRTKRLIVASGLTSNPNLPTYEGADTFTAPFFHAKDFCKRASVMDTAKNAVVVGGGKSALDVAYIFACENKCTVDLVIRPTGGGPAWLCPPYVTPLKRSLEELLHTRFLSWMSPCFWQKESGWWGAHRWLQQTFIGRFIVEKFWQTITNEVIDTHGYDKDKELGKLKPWESAKWTGSAVGIHNFPTNIHDLIRQGQIRVHVADIDRLDGRTVRLSDGVSVETDVLICATGWKKGSDFNFKNFDLNLPLPQDEIERMCAVADRKVLETFPVLQKQPDLRNEAKPAEPLRNYRFIVPSQAIFKRNLAFAGALSTTATSCVANAQGLWISAFFDGKLDRFAKDDKEAIDEIILHTQFEKIRYPCGYGASLPDFAFDCVQYIDLLLTDLNIPCNRKSSYLKELFSPYKPRDYKGLTQEWATSHHEKF